MRINCAKRATVTILLIIFCCLHQSPVSAVRTKKASKSALKQIKSLLNSKIERELPQSDFAFNEPPVFVRNPNARPYRDELSVNDPDEHFQGDVDLSVKQAKLLLEQLTATGHSSKGKRTKRKIGKEPFYKRWDRQRPISYGFDQAIPETTRRAVKAALDIWEKYTCIRFKEDGPDIDRLEFYDGGGCSSFVGRAGGTQGVSISTPGCETTGIISHEVGHALGLFHEQARPDQERNLQIHYNNIPITRWNNFYPVGNDQAELFGLPYDAGSLMHYNTYAFATNPYHPTISTLDKNFYTTIGQRGGPSFLDIQAINIAYNCHDKCSKKLKCKNNGYTNPNDCSQCICPMGLGGEVCDQVQHSTCGATIKATTDKIVIETPNYPQTFPYNIDCYWLVQAPKGGKVFMEFVDQFDFECSEPCDGSFVEVKARRDMRPVGYRFCCSTKPDKTFMTEGSQLIVLHRSLGTLGRGFRAQIWSDKDQFPLTLPATQVTKEPTTTTSTMTSTAITTLATILTTEEFSSTTEFITLPGELPTSAKFGVESNEIDEIEKELTFPTLPTLFGTTITLPTTSTDSTTVEECMCGPWGSWIGECTQVCGGCGRRTRARACRSDNCRKEEKKGCNFAACPPEFKFLLNNGEFHFLFQGCCVGLFPNKNVCGGLEDPLLNFLYKLLRPEDAGNSTVNA